MVEPIDTTIEEREELMVSLTYDGKPVRRIAHFLKPSVLSEQVSNLPSHSLYFSCTDREPPHWPLTVRLVGWRSLPVRWKSWIDHLLPVYQSTWKEVGIYEAIISSTYKIQKPGNNDLLFCIAERWVPETNTFVFPWGEATITLEDVVILGGFSVLGDSVFCYPDARELKETEEFNQAMKKLMEVRRELVKSKQNNARHGAWISYFLQGGREFEHEAFLALWLSRFVFPKLHDSISTAVFPIAVNLARGKRIALAPAVLASIYRDLSLLRKTMIASTDLDGNGESALTLYAPLQIVQIWVFERFVSLSQPRLIEDGELRSARWHKKEMLKLDNVRLTLDSAGDSFQWRPYTRSPARNNWSFPKFYGEKEEWVYIGDPDLHPDFLSFARCLSVCELVGVDEDCIEQYLPHRVAMQFGMDQDIPCRVPQCNQTREMAWRSFNKPISPDAKLYIPLRLFDPDVTARYMEWWKKSLLIQQDSVKGVVLKQKSMKSLLCDSNVVKKNNGSVSPGFPLIKLMPMEEADIDEDINKGDLSQNLMSSTEDGESAASSSIARLIQNLKGAMRDNDASVPPCSPPKRKRVDNAENFAMGGSENTMKDMFVNKEDSPVYNDKEEGSSSYRTLELPGLELEARITKLERVVARLKATRFC